MRINKESDKVLISNIQRFSVHDGPGIRTVVFCQGCPLRCKWCQNPENLYSKPQLMFYRQKCTVCMKCVSICPEEAIFIDNTGEINTNRNKCNVCGKCTYICSFGAREISGKLYSVEEVFNEVVKDRVAYKNTGGGVTLSGGEFLIYPRFIINLFKKCKNSSIHTAIETSGYSKWNWLRQVAEYTDLFLYDIKLISSDKHQQWTGVDNKLILENARKLSKLGNNLVIRVPLIPKINDTRDEFLKIVKFAKTLDNVNEIHLLPFHQLGKSKYDALDIDYDLKDLEEQKSEKVMECKNIANEHGFKVSVGGSGFKEENIKKNKEMENNFYIYDF